MNTNVTGTNLTGTHLSTSGAKVHTHSICRLKVLLVGKVISVREWGLRSVRSFRDTEYGMTIPNLANLYPLIGLKIPRRQLLNCILGLYWDYTGIILGLCTSCTERT